MRYLVYDIETAAIPFDELDPSQQEYIVRGCKTDEERDERIRLMSLNPLTAKVVAIGMLLVPSLDAEPKGCVYSTSDQPVENETLSDGSIWRAMSEREVMEKWWEVISHGRDGYHLISFNGRGFDCPFLMLRSAVLHVKPRRNLMEGTRWNYRDHTDLLDELAYKSNDRSGPMKRFNFDFYCKSFGIKSPKSEGITGMDVANLYADGKHREIAEYCMRDVRATWDLYKFWKEYLSGGEIC